MYINTVNSIMSALTPHNDTASSNEGFGNYINNVSNSPLRNMDIMPDLTPGDFISAIFTMVRGLAELGLYKIFPQLVEVHSFDFYQPETSNKDE